MLKERKVLKQFFGKSIKTIATFCLCATTLIGGVVGGVVAFKVTSQSPEAHYVPSQEQAMKHIVEATGGKDKTFLFSDNVARMPIREGFPIKINFQFMPTRAQKVVFEDAVEEFNEVFSIINSNYVFELNYSPTPNDLNSPYNINVDTTSNLNAGVLGQAHATLKDKTSSIDGLEIYDKTITLRNGLEQDVNACANVFRHEFFHLLGAGDAYKNENASENTVMQSISGGDIHYSLTNLDVTILDALYRSPNNELLDEQVQNFTGNYLTQTSHTKENLYSKITKTMLSQMDVNQIKNEIKKNYTNKTALEFAEKLNKISIDENFGTEDISFGQIQSLTSPDIAYFYELKDGDVSSFYGTSAKSFTQSDSEITNADGILTSYNTTVVCLNGIICSFEHDAGFETFKLSGLYEQTEKTAEEYYQNTFNNRQSREL